MNGIEKGPLIINNLKLRHERIFRTLDRSLINVQIKESFPGRAIFCFLSKSEKEILDVGEK